MTPSGTDDGGYTFASTGIQVTCNRCGLLVGHRALHDRYHYIEDAKHPAQKASSVS